MQKVVNFLNALYSLFICFKLSKIFTFCFTLFIYMFTLLKFCQLFNSWIRVVSIDMSSCGHLQYANVSLTH